MTTILNPAPAAELPDGMLAMCDYVTPNETETEELTGIPVSTIGDAHAAAAVFMEMGVKGVVITLGERGAYYRDRDHAELVPAISAGPVVETTGAGDAFNGGFAVGLARGDDPVTAVKFGAATAGISVTRPGTAPSMPTLDEVSALLAQ